MSWANTSQVALMLWSLCDEVSTHVIFPSSITSNLAGSSISWMRLATPALTFPPDRNLAKHALDNSTAKAAFMRRYVAICQTEMWFLVRKPSLIECNVRIFVFSPLD